VDDLTKNATTIVNQTFQVIEPYLAVALLYWLMIELIARGGYALEKRLANRQPRQAAQPGATHANG